MAIVRCQQRGLPVPAWCSWPLFFVLFVPGVVGYSQQLGRAASFCRGVSGMGLSPNDLPGQLSCTSAQDRVHCQYPVSTAAVWNQCFLST